MRRFMVLAVGVILAGLVLLHTVGHDEPGASAFAASGSDRFGIVHISYGNNAPEDARYRMGTAAGARWNRWALYWDDVEATVGNFNYRPADATVAGDATKGLQMQVVLLGTPAPYAVSGAASLRGPRLERKFYLPSLDHSFSPRPYETSAATSVPWGLKEPVFADGTDQWAPGKAINPKNYWARFVNATVARYQARVKHWEMWNEPDWPAAQGGFWGGTIADYFRLLKVGYLAAKAADPEAKVLIGGLTHRAFNPPENFLPKLLDLIRQDRDAARNNHYFDILPFHFYSRPSDLWDGVILAQAMLRARGMAQGKEIWVNETNVPVLDDPAVPVGDPRSPGRATMDEQASFILQAYAYGLAAGAQRIFTFQLYDDYVGPGEAYGLVRNLPSSPVYPADGKPRPAYTTYQAAAKYLGSFSSATKSTAGSVERIIFQGTPYGRVTVFWNRSPQHLTATLPMVNPVGAQMLDKFGKSQALRWVGSTYQIVLPGATNNRNFQGNPKDYIIGGSPYILVEPRPARLFFPLVVKRK